MIETIHLVAIVFRAQVHSVIDIFRNWDQIKSSVNQICYWQVAHVAARKTWIRLLRPTLKTRHVG
jgi:hypothetical protein